MDMPTTQAENLDLFVNARHQFERALTWIDDLKVGLVEYLINPKRTIHVRFPIHIQTAKEARFRCLECGQQRLFGGGGGQS